MAWYVVEALWGGTDEHGGIGQYEVVWTGAVRGKRN